MLCVCLPASPAGTIEFDHRQMVHGAQGQPFVIYDFMSSFFAHAMGIQGTSSRANRHSIFFTLVLPLPAALGCVAHGRLCTNVLLT